MENTIPSQVAVQQLGEYLVSANLCRMNFTVSFTPRNFPDIDIIAANESLKTVSVQVKTIHDARSRDWQLNADKFLEIDMVNQPDGRVKQIIAGKKTLNNPDIIWVFVKLHEEKEKDEFFVCSVSDIQQICHNSYSQSLAKIDGMRKENPKSKHFTVSVKEVEPFRNNWELFLPFTRN